MVLRFHMTLVHEHFKRVWILLLVVASPSYLVASLPFQFFMASTMPTCGCDFRKGQRS